MEDNVFRVDMPLRIVWGKGKTTRFIFNLNLYRNAHYQQLSRAKREYTDLAVSRIYHAQIPKMKKINILYVYYPKTRVRSDIGNVCSIHDKFFQDALVKAGIIEDDNFNFVTGVLFRFGKHDPENPRMEIYIKEVLE